LTPSTQAAQAYANTYGTRSSIAAFKRAYQARMSAKANARAALATLYSPDGGGSAQVGDASAAPVEPSFQQQQQQQHQQLTTVASPTGVALDVASAERIMVHSEPAEATPADVAVTAAAVAADDKACDLISGLLGRPPPPPPPTTTTALGVSDFLDPASARAHRHNRAKSAGAYAAHIQAIAAQQQQATAAANAVAATAVPSSSARSEQARSAQIQQLLSTLEQQQQQQQQQQSQHGRSSSLHHHPHHHPHLSRTPAEGTPRQDHMQQQQQHPHQPSYMDPPASAPPGAVLDPDIDERMTPLNILDETNQVFHEMYKQWFRDEIAAERREAKRRAQLAASDGVTAYSPSRSLFSEVVPRGGGPGPGPGPPGPGLLPQSLHINVAAAMAVNYNHHGGVVDEECRTPLSAAQQRCYTPGGGHTLLALMTASNSRAGSGANTPAWGAQGGGIWGNNQQHSSQPTTPVRGAHGGGGARLHSPDHHQQQQQQVKTQRVPITLPSAQSAANNLQQQQQQHYEWQQHAHQQQQQQQPAPPQLYHQYQQQPQ
jgi:hypothetical protein